MFHDVYIFYIAKLWRGWLFLCGSVWQFPSLQDRSCCICWEDPRMGCAGCAGCANEDLKHVQPMVPDGADFVQMVQTKTFHKSFVKLHEILRNIRILLLIHSACCTLSLLDPRKCSKPTEHFNHSLKFHVFEHGGILSSDHVYNMF